MRRFPVVSERALFVNLGQELGYSHLRCAHRICQGQTRGTASGLGEKDNTSNQLEQRRTRTPDVHRWGVSGLGKNLGGHELESAS